MPRYEGGWARKQGQARWRAVLEAAEDGRHVSDEHLWRLVEEYPVPDFARPYIAERGLDGAPSGRPPKPPLSPLFPEWMPAHFDAGPIPWSWASEPPPVVARHVIVGADGLDTGRVLYSGPNGHRGPFEWAPKTPGIPSKFVAVAAVQRRTKRYRRFRTRRKPRLKNRWRMEHNPDTGIWTVKAPKKRAREKVAASWEVSTSTLEKWEAQVRDWQSRVLPDDI